MCHVGVVVMVTMTVNQFCIFVNVLLWPESSDQFGIRLKFHKISSKHEEHGNPIAVSNLVLLSTVTVK